MYLKLQGEWAVLQVVDRLIRRCFRGLSLGAALVVGGCSGDPSEDHAACGDDTEAGESVCLTTVRGLVVDESDDPAPDVPVTVCGPVCFRGVSDEQGRFAIEVNTWVQPELYSVQPHGSPHASTFYYPLPHDLKDGKYDTGQLRILDLPSDGDILTTKTDLEIGQDPPAQTVRSEGVMLELGAGTTVLLSVADALDGEEGRRFRARELDASEKEEFAPELSDARVFALGPFEAEFKPQDADEPLDVQLSLTNDKDWEAGAEIEFLVLGTYLAPDWLEPSVFSPLSPAVVSDDGERISWTGEGSDLRHLTWIALRPDVR